MNETTENKASKSIGKNIRAMRHKRNWSQEDIANKLGISIPAFSKIETGVTDINLSRLKQIAKIYEVSVVQLLTLNEELVEPQQLQLNAIQKKLVDRESEITTLQRKVIELYEELRTKNYAM